MAVSDKVPVCYNCGFKGPRRYSRLYMAAQILNALFFLAALWLFANSVRSGSAWLALSHWDELAFIFGCPFFARYLWKDVNGWRCRNCDAPGWSLKHQG